MPGISRPLSQNKPQKFSRFNTRYPVFKDLPFGYVAEPRWFAAEGLPVTNWDDAGRLNAYPLMRIRAVPKGKAVTASNLLASVDTVTPYPVKPIAGVVTLMIIPVMGRWAAMAPQPKPWPPYLRLQTILSIRKCLPP
jgi:hypothetical protein